LRDVVGPYDMKPGDGYNRQNRKDGGIFLALLRCV